MTLPPSDGSYEIDCHAVASELREDMTKTEAVSDLPWKCAGCGAEAVGRTKPCDCITNCGYRMPEGGKMEHTTFVPVVDHAAEFARWIEQGPALALAAGVYVGIKVYASEDQARQMGDIS